MDLTCEVTVGLMPVYLEDDLSEGEVVLLEQHIMVCPGCHTYLAQLRQTIRAVSGLRGEELRSQVWQGIAARLPADGASGSEPADRVMAYKFLSQDRISPFAQVRWPERDDGWVYASAPAGACRRAVHACRAHDLAYWLGERLWRVELAGRITEVPSKIAAERGRLLEEVKDWPKVSDAFVKDCAARLGQLLSQAEKQQEDRAVRFLVTYESEIDKDTDPASVSYTTAHAADVVGWTPEEARAAETRGERSPFESERRRQGRWLADKLGLAP